MSRRSIGILLLTTGALGLAFVAGGYVRGYLARERARAAWAALEAQRDVAGVRETLSAGAEPAALVSGAPIGRLVIADIGLDEVVVEGIGDDELNAGPGHMPGTAIPGWRGNAVLSAHRDRHFHRLDEVHIGDTVRTTTRGGATTWVVTDRRVVSRFARVIRPTDTPVLTLTTCWPVRYFGPAPDRLILTAKPVDGTTVPPERSSEASVAIR
jgi:LPXTG-site transpeptidase (sortase) family protein